ncbi:hypothetical protein SAMN05414139_10271 [Burkholderia sp. D7]|nr:hypothetical protein SAMN05414139_10271 [Burkholderia sp. D7]
MLKIGHPHFVVIQTTEQNDMTDDPKKLAVAKLAHDLVAGYYAVLVAHYVAANPTSINALPPSKDLGKNPIGEIPRNDGTARTLDMRHSLDAFREDHDLQTRSLRTWAMGSLLTLGDELKAHGYFDRAPILELVYHLRNGMAHGNRFHIDGGGKQALGKFAAHNRDAAVRSPFQTVFEITPTTHGRILFDFMGPGDVIDLFLSVEAHLSR